MITFSIARRCAILSLLLCGAACAFAQPYPNRPIRLIVPFAPGGGADNLARTLNAALTEGFGQSVVIDNRGGGGGTIGTELVARAAPDGYTLALVTTGHTINPSLLPKIPFDPIKDFEPICLVASQSNVLVVHPSLPAHSVKELVALARAKPGGLNFASGGIGSSPHLSGELLKLVAHVDIAQIPYSRKHTIRSRVRVAMCRTYWRV
jgi:tripartite-type tricarboxylate transporter receptor subunit TctC